MNKIISVIISTYNPNKKIFAQTLGALEDQTLDKKLWELIIVNNNSSVYVEPDLSWHPAAQIVDEPRQGLTYGRIKGIQKSNANIIILLDDDNLLQPDYLNQVMYAFEVNTKLGAVGGKSLPIFESPPPKWTKEFYGCLALRDMGEEPIYAKWDGHSYPACAPIGAGMAIRKDALKSYINKIKERRITVSDRKAGELTSGGDNDIVLEILKSGFEIAYLPALILHHIIPGFRLKGDYLGQLQNQINRSWIWVLDDHGICPWNPISRRWVRLRKILAYFKNKAWLNRANFTRWRAACGMFDGLADIKYNRL